MLAEMRALLLLLLATPAYAQPIAIVRAEVEPAIDGRLDDAAWSGANAVRVDRDYRGRPVPLETLVRFVWSPDALFVAFDCAYTELHLSEAPAGEVDDLYRYDVVELFVDPSPDTRDTYLEIELDPAGHHLDVGVDRGRRPRGDIAWSSGVTHASYVGPDRFVIEARIPAAAFGLERLRAGEWRGNVYRIAGASPDRTFIAYFPTRTTRPSFHVPARFGALVLR